MFMAVLVSVSKADCEESAKSEENCARSERCQKLKNEKPDYNQVEAKVLEVVDADSIRLELYMWPKQTVTMLIRLKGVDTPELRGAKCPEEKRLARQAKKSIENKLPIGSWVLVSDLGSEKYGGRLVADVERWVGDRLKSASEELLENQRWAVPYDGGGKTKDWCAN
jgi:micrococcal nuclease